MALDPFKLRAFTFHCAHGDVPIPRNWTCPATQDTNQPQSEACSNAPGLLEDNSKAGLNTKPEYAYTIVRRGEISLRHVLRRMMGAAATYRHGDEMDRRNVLQLTLTGAVDTAHGRRR